MMTPFLPVILSKENKQSDLEENMSFSFIAVPVYHKFT